MNCSNCAKGKEKNQEFTLVGMLAASNRRMFIALMTALILLCGSWIGFFVYESQFEDVVTEITQENEDGYNNYIGNDGDIYNGEANDKNP